MISGGVAQDGSPQEDSTDITSNLSGLSGSLNIKSVLMNTFLLAFPHRFLADLDRDQKTDELLLADRSSGFSWPQSL